MRPRRWRRSKEERQERCAGGRRRAKTLLSTYSCDLSYKEEGGK